MRYGEMEHTKEDIVQTYDLGKTLGVCHAV